MPWNDLHILTSVSKALVNALIHNCIIIIIFFCWKLLTESIREHVSSAFDQTVHYNGLLIAKVGTVNTECSRVYRTDVLRHSGIFGLLRVLQEQNEYCILLWHP